MDKKKILVVDDEEDVRETLSTVLENLDYDPYVAADGEEASNDADNSETASVTEEMTNENELEVTPEVIH